MGRPLPSNVHKATLLPLTATFLSGASDALSSGLPSKNVNPASWWGIPSEVTDHPGTGDVNCCFTAIVGGQWTTSAAESVNAATASAMRFNGRLIRPPPGGFERPAANRDAARETRAAEIAPKGGRRAADRFQPA